MIELNHHGLSGDNGAMFVESMLIALIVGIGITAMVVALLAQFTDPSPGGGENLRTRR